MATAALESEAFALEPDYPAWIRLMSMVEPARLEARGLSAPHVDCPASEISIWFVERAGNWTAVGPAHVQVCGPDPFVTTGSHEEAIRRSLARYHSKDPDRLSFFCWVGRTHAFGPGGEDPWVTLRAELLEGLSTELATVEAELRAVDFRCDFASAESF